MFKFKRAFCSGLLGFFWIVFGEAQVDSPKTIALLISLDSTQEEVSLQLQEIFKNHYRRQNYKLVIRQQADQFHLWEAVHSHDYLGVVWVSHGCYQKTDFLGLETCRSILDYQGFDVTPIFQEVSPNLRFLAVVSCQSKQILQSISEKDASMPGSSPVEFILFDEVVNSNVGLTKVLKQSDHLLTQVRPSSVQDSLSRKKEIPIKITRTFSPTRKQKISAARIESQGHVLGVFPSAQPLESEQKITVYLPLQESASQRHQYDLLLTSGAMVHNPHIKDELGEVVFSEPWEGARWEQSPFGKLSKLFIFKGVEPIELLQP